MIIQGFCRTLWMDGDCRSLRTCTSWTVCAVNVMPGQTDQSLYSWCSHCIHFSPATVPIWPFQHHRHGLLRLPGAFNLFLSLCAFFSLSLFLHLWLNHFPPFHTPSCSAHFSPCGSQQLPDLFHNTV